MKYETKNYLTKQALCDALKSLLTVKNFQHITIRDITAEAGFNRQTFYYHFKDIYDLLSWGFEQEMDLLADYLQNKSHNTWKEAWTRVIQYISQNKYLCSCIVNGIGREQLILTMHESICNVIRQIVTHEADLRPVPAEHMDFTVEFYASAVSNCVYNWVKNGMRESPEAMLSHLMFVVGPYQTVTVKA